MNLKTFTLLAATSLIPATTLLADEDARRAEKERAVAELKEREAHRAKKRNAMRNRVNEMPAPSRNV